MLEPTHQVLALAPALSTEAMDDTGVLLQLVEESRKERQRRIDAGDETVRLKFSPLALQQQPRETPIPANSPLVSTSAAAAAAAAGARWIRPTNWQQQPGRGGGYGPAGGRGSMGKGVGSRWPAAPPGYASRQPYMSKWRV